MGKLLKQNKQAFSLLETLVSLGIFAIVIAMFSNVMVSSLATSLKVTNRTALREELASVANLIRKDLRSAREVVSCADPAVSQSTSVCQLLIDNQVVTWRECPTQPGKICKLGPTSNVLFMTSDRLSLRRIAFETGFETGITNSQRNILLTLIVSHTNNRLSINNLVYQANISNRNYDLTFSIPTNR